MDSNLSVNYVNIQGTAFGQPYFGVDFENLTNSGTYNSDYFLSKYHELITWCTQVLGSLPKTLTINQRWYFNNGIFWFCDKRDLTVFLLRWG